ncbi:MAG: HPr family phosphocarrier protein [Acidobacteria bacterium]|nr:HPr family phosphocarrier protein [Acidobacteriota bacterium]
MLECSLRITNRLGLHARAAARLVRLANQHRSRILLSRTDIEHEPADAKSIFGVLLLAAAQGTLLRVTADGPDEEQALHSISRLIEDKFGED